MPTPSLSARRRLAPAILRFAGFAGFAVATPLAFASPASQAAQGAASGDSQQVLVTAREQPMEQKSYRDLLAAMDRFERYRRVHPDAQLRFRIYQRKEGADFSHLRAWILDPEDGSRVELAIAPDGGFTVPVLAAQREHDAVVRTNMPDGLLAWMVEVRRASDGERHRLLGDLREACLLDVDFAHLGRTVKLPAFYAVDALASNVCLLHGVDWGFYAEKPVFSVHMSAGDRQMALLSDRLHGALGLPVFFPLVDWAYLLRDRLYAPPLNDSSWPDETAVDVVYADDVDDPAPTSSPVAAATAPNATDREHP